MMGKLNRRFFFAERNHATTFAICFELYVFFLLILFNKFGVDNIGYYERNPKRGAKLFLE